jgi:FixJ family two-component response regulator
MASLVAVVDDDESVNRSIVRLLRQLDIKARAFVCGQDLLDAIDLGGYAPDCILLDAQMPGLSGPEVQAELIRRAVRCPVVVMTAYSDANRHERAIALGSVAVLFKPFDEQLFISTVQAALQ